MKRLANLPWFAPFLALLLIMCGIGHAAAQGVPSAIPIPSVTGPIPVTADSYPLMAVNTLQTVVDLPKFGYIEEEFFVSGRANIYEWAADGTLSVKTPAAPYTTRILLRRPVDPRNFSGNVMVDLANVNIGEGRQFDWSFMWPLSYERVIEHGDAWVLLTYSPDIIDAMKRFNPRRYAPLSMANPTPDQTCAAGGAAGRASPTGEEGLKWDILSQLGALLKAGRSAGPLAGFTVQRVYGTSHFGELPTYIAAIHPHANLPNGRPIYDGYVVMRHASVIRMHRCGAAPAATDPRHILRNVNVPVLRLVSQTDVLATYARRREDSDAVGDRYRLYEVPGAAHSDAIVYGHIPSLADQKASGSPPYLAYWPFPNQCEQEISLMRLPVMSHALHAAFANLDRWILDGIAPPRAPRLSTENGGTPQARIVTDQFGNAVGGVRSPYLDVPVATYYTSTRGEGLCANLGHAVPFDWTRLETLYGTSRNYAAKVAESVDRLVRERWLTESDGRKIKAETVVPATSSR